MSAPDELFANPRLALVYDAMDPDRTDLELYLELTEAFGARSVLDIGCGTGTFALLLATRGVEVVAVDPAAASIDVAKAKPGADRIRWICGDVGHLPELSVDAATMTANVAQVFLDENDWRTTLAGIRDALAPGGRLLFEVRDPARRAWEDWAAGIGSKADIDGIGMVESSIEVLDVSLPYVSFRWTYRFDRDGAVLTSDSTLRFRERQEIEEALAATGFEVDELLDAPDRPGKEFVFVASARADQGAG